MRNILLGITTAGLLFTACNSSNQPDKDPTLASPATEVSTTPASTNAAAQETLVNQKQTLPTVNTPAAGAITAGLNPEHGQPNHRCDIAVGAPLNSPAPAAMQAPVSSPMPAAVQPTMALPTTGAAVQPTMTLPTTGAASGKINPPHGEPGHSCAIAVGATLP